MTKLRISDNPIYPDLLPPILETKKPRGGGAWHQPGFSGAAQTQKSPAGAGHGLNNHHDDLIPFLGGLG
tara:strand:+ start:1815 stop:2021 length:207 start_codon:yes stop_codon:yes gene_type:complete